MEIVWVITLNINQEVQELTNLKTLQAFNKYQHRCLEEQVAVTHTKWETNHLLWELEVFLQAQVWSILLVEAPPKSQMPVLKAWWVPKVAPQLTF